ncbi:hypothetical protein MN032_07150 [Agromyces atrinae]|uniref:hypothetical protein n=1 Tax=Agromyces atrinae TaxID=592376 RepID=UPI001F55C501|nr:hypothetical protein [Agromyces atrinae]MCI2957462.1 hypothetical protein [Agromyces atrinae]
MRADRLLTVAAAAVLLVPLAGCAASEPQELTVDYSTGTEDIERVIELPGVLCTSVAGRSLFSSTAPRPADGPGEFAAAIDDASGESDVVSVQISDDLWFTSTDPYTATSDGVRFDGVVGAVSPLGPTGLPSTDVIDPEATLSGTLTCTERRDTPSGGAP